MHFSHDRKSPNLHFSPQKCTKQPNLAAAFNSFGIFVICTRYSAIPQVPSVLGERMEVLVSEFIGSPIYPEIYPLPVYHPESEAFYR